MSNIPDNSSLLTLGFNIVNDVSSKIIALASQKGLGSEIGTVGVGGDLTKVGDEYAEKITRSLISQFIHQYKNISVLLITEETGIISLVDKGTDGIFFILDPLDGSNNLRKWKTPSPYVSISLAIGRLKDIANTELFNGIELGIVRDIFNNRVYYAEKDKGASVVDFGEIKSSPEEELKNAILGVDMDLQGEQFVSLSEKLLNLIKNTKCQRRLGSTILDFIKVGCGEYDAFVSITNRMKVYDIAAAQLIVKEAGGIFEFIDLPETMTNILSKMIQTRDNTLLEKSRFKIITSGNHTLHNQIKDLLK